MLTYLAREGLELPSQRLHRGIGRVITWQGPRYHVIYQMLTNPMYAGIYAYGRRQELIDPLEKTVHVLHKARSEWRGVFTEPPSRLPYPGRIRGELGNP